MTTSSSEVGLQSHPKPTKMKLSQLILKELSHNDGNKSTIKLVGLEITKITDEDVSFLRSVERLSLRKNHITSLPSTFHELKNLRYLDLHSNSLSEIPSVILQCPQLEIVDFSSNKIKNLPEEISTLWKQNLKVLSLKNNDISTIYSLKSIIYLENLSVLEIDQNSIPQEELEAVQSYTPLTNNITREEYWAIAIRRYLKDHVQEAKMSKASKRMGFINSLNSSNSMVNTSGSSISLSNGVVANNSYGTTPTSTNNNSNGNNNTTNIIEASEAVNNSNNESNTSLFNSELYNHSKYNDYFKRLSILPEENSTNEEHKIPHAELVLSCRKLLFSFTECQQSIRRIASFCKENAIAVDIVSLLYSVRSHIDNLVEVLQQAENDENPQDEALIKLCMIIISIFKKIIALLRKNFETFFENDDLCFVRMFYMTLLCSYTEMYNAWTFISSEKPKATKKKSITQKDSSIISFHAGHRSSNSANSTTSNGSSNTGTVNYKSRTRSNTLQNRIVSNPSTSIESTPSSILTQSLNTMAGNIATTPANVMKQTSTAVGSVAIKSSSSPNGSKNNSNIFWAHSTSAPLHRNHSILGDESPSPSPSVITSQSLEESPKKMGQRSPRPSLILKGKNELSNNSIAIGGVQQQQQQQQQQLSTSPPTARSKSNPIINSAISGTFFNTANTNPNANSPPRMNASTASTTSMVSAGPGTTATTTVHVPAIANTQIPTASVTTNTTTTTTTTTTTVTPISSSEEDVDLNLYQTLLLVVKTVNVVYNQLTAEISKVALASSTGQQILTDLLATKIKDLTDTCWQAMELSKVLHGRLNLLLSKDPNVAEKYLTNVEKLKTWENINSFLKSIISILANAKILMTELPHLNDIRPNLASLAKITKDVTVILDLSSYKVVSMNAQTQAQAQAQSQSQAPAQAQGQGHNQTQMYSNTQAQAQLQQQQIPITKDSHVPLLTPQVKMSNQNVNPFEQQMNVSK
ncbi:Sog2p NDAI_0E03740 [Naumovozyma dairenensis CBS 421]|uniref:RAM signaling network component n=1 Tax=Naumovozyma dairenensis (strain ATCC 10597 / BCRC 20456 / CBS 421 / NBRC 0211 / NRRL Y-12639) TaxID=1071378 RepID=G0WBS1_NAUDC|nr:hypothetical protein NDAI_0E03740 [Naumovozyma dairenensis CBS 421]CCD25191.1 hypothetical protein NDAI_0E03740 [Naumovozyma dairenensis CBS 421]